LNKFRLFTTFAGLAILAPLGVASDGGKALYDNSCVACHGPSGAGNPVMDKFYKLRIPRLSEEYVQKKSDNQLSDVILNGKRKMPAAMDGLPETQHRTKITAAQVPDLVIYIRTFKNK
jgi:mono/diheme cytochrome c family protein